MSFTEKKSLFFFLQRSLHKIHLSWNGGQLQLQTSIYGMFQEIQLFLVMSWLCFLRALPASQHTLYESYAVTQASLCTKHNEKHVISLTKLLSRYNSWAPCNSNRMWLQNYYSSAVCTLINFMQLWLFFFFWPFRVPFAAHGGSQVRGRIRTTAARLHHSHSNAGSKSCLWPTPQFTAMPDP